MDKFKFCSVMSEDTLEFFLEYFPELKKKCVHEIKGNSLPHARPARLYLTDCY